MARHNTLAYTADDELDLSREWGVAARGAGHDELRAYFERERPHLLKVYDADFLVSAVERARAAPQVGR
jgi:hypothetical protein